MNKEKQPKISKGNKQSLFIAFAFFSFLVFINVIFSSASYAKDTVSVAVVNVTFLMENAPQSEFASNRLKEKFLPQEKKLAEKLETITSLETELKKIKASKNKDKKLERIKERELRSLKRSRTRSLQDFREELRFARDSALDDVQKEVFNAIHKVRELQNIDIVLQDYVSANKRVDITPQVLEYLKKRIGKTSLKEKTIDKKTNNKERQKDVKNDPS